ncbi:MAG TPA: dephospho-CoA kinase [Actinomycetota bacterium]|nr:dephospho-CoA kinase [Actinomycetota bacterium]
MLLVGLTGGIGSGKSTVARLLEQRGAIVFDADVLARAAVEPGALGHRQVVERFGAQVLAPGGGIDREALASIVFRDPAARRDLEAIVHPEVRRLFAEGCERFDGTDRVVVFSAPLLVETGMHSAFDVLLVVSTSVQTQVDRLMRERGMPEAQARDRIAAQAPVEVKAELADHLIENEGSMADLEVQVERVWTDLVERAHAGAASG